MLNKLTGTPDIPQIEETLRSIRPTPGVRFYQRMENVPWKRGRTLNEGENRMKRRYIVSAIAALVLVITAVLAITPAGRALANELLQFFTRSQGNTLPLPPDQVMPVVPTSTQEPPYTLPLLPAAQVNSQTATPRATSTLPAPPAGSEQDIQPLADIQSARSLAGFGWGEPAQLPRDYRMTGIQFDPIQQAVILRYVSPRAGSGEFFQITQGKNLAPFSVGANAQVEKVSLGQAQAEFVRGGWFTPNGATQSTWEKDANVYTLRWQAGETMITIVFFVNETFSPAYLEKEEMLAVGRSLMCCEGGPANPVGQVSTPVQKFTYDQAIESFAGVEKAAGRDLLEPGLLPAGLAFSHARYDADNDSIMLFYGSFAPDKIRSNGPVLLINTGPDPSPVGDYDRQYYPPEAIQEASVHGQPAQVTLGYLETGTAQPGQPEPTPAWKSGPITISIRWSENGRVYVLRFQGSYSQNAQVSVEDMLKVAESMH